LAPYLALIMALNQQVCQLFGPPIFTTVGTLEHAMPNVHVAAQRVAGSHEQVFEAGKGEFGGGHTVKKAIFLPAPHRADTASGWVGRW
jgi:hypothetical protein